MSERRRPSRLYTVAPGRAFLPALARAVLDGVLPEPGTPPPDGLDLSRYTILLPTRRAARALGAAFLEASGGRAMLLPAIRPISEGQEDLGLLADAAGMGGAAALEIPPAIGSIERTLILTRLVSAWSASLRTRPGDELEAGIRLGAETPAQAARLAAELAALMDMVETEGVSLSRLDQLVPEEYAAHWAETLEFLKIVVQFWPAALAEEGRISAVDRRNRLLRAEAARIATLPPSGPIIVAGVTGSIPATVDVIKAVLARPEGAVLLPAFDTTLDQSSLDLIRTHHPEHPQYGLARLVAALGAEAADVTELPGATPARGRAARRALVTEALRPATETGRWHDYIAKSGPETLDGALDGLALVAAPTAQDEAEVVSLILRQVIETPGQTAALVSPDRNLARRVTARLETMGIEIDDSAGRPFNKTPPGAFLNLVIDAFSADFAPKPVMALLKHPLLRLSRPVPVIRRAARALEIIAFRTLYLGRGLDGIERAIDAARVDVAGKRRRERAILRLWEPDWDAALDCVRALKAAYAPLLDLGTDAAQPLHVWAEAHAATADRLALTGESAAEGDDGAIAEISKLWHEDAGEEAQQFFASLAAAARHTPDIAAADYPDFYRNLVSGINIRPKGPVHPRISIWGPFEARLQEPDVVILGSLNDGTWPEAADPGAWLNRPMLKELGLPAPEEKIGYAAHDFTSLLGAGTVYLTRAEKVDGNPTVPSRWLLRLTALLDGLARRDGKTAADLLAPAEPWLDWARARDLADTPPPARPPEPRPPLALRPRQMSVTEIERWLANPYAIYARHVLKLEKLPDLGKEPGASERGQIIHEALSRFAERFPKTLPPDIARALLEDARAAMDAYAAHPRVAAFWLPRFARFAEWFADTEAGRRVGIDEVAAEVSGAEIIAAPGGPFTLRARADRIDIAKSALHIVDYKTGSPPTAKRVLAGLAPQLPLEAAIALAGGFTATPARPVDKLVYIRASGGVEAGKESILKLDATAIADLAKATRDRLADLVARFDDETTPYRAARRRAFASSYDYDDYAHLARAAEWSGGDVTDDSDEGDEA